MDDIDDPIGKISHQLSEMATIPNPAVSLSSVPPELSVSWTQFSGISPQTDQASFKNLCTWNHLDLPDFTPLAQPTEPEPHSSPHHFSVDSGLYGGCSDFLNQNQYNWHKGNSLQQRFQVAGEVNERLGDVSRNRAESCGFDQQNFSNLRQHNFQTASHVFQYDGINSRSAVPLRQQMSQPSRHNPFVGLGRYNTHSASSASGLGVPDMQVTEDVDADDDIFLTHNNCHEGITGDISVNNLTRIHQIQSQASHTPHSLSSIFPVEKNHCENFQHIPCPFSNSSHNDYKDYIIPEKLNMNFDLGTTIDRKDQPQPASSDNFCPSMESPKVSNMVKKQWHSFDSNGTHSPIIQKTSHTQPQGQKLFSKPLISADSSKPSYSDVAKTPKLGTARSGKTNMEGSIRNSSKAVKRDEKQVRHLASRISLASKSFPRGSSGEVDQPRVPPTSKYGLDSFGDQLSGAEIHCNNSDNLPHLVRSRQGSDSSAGSSFSAHSDTTTQGAVTTASSENDPIGLTQGVVSPGVKQSFLTARTVKLVSSSKSPNVSSQTASQSQESVFFDPRRIFQFKDSDRIQSQSSACSKAKKTAGANSDDLGNSSISDTVLNNDKPTASTVSSKLSSNARQHSYINNDLRDASKLTNQAVAESCQGAGGGKVDIHPRHRESQSGRGLNARTNETQPHNRRKSHDGHNKMAEDSDGVANQQHKAAFLFDVDTEKLEEWCSLVWKKLKHWGKRFVNSWLNFCFYLLGIILFLASACIHLFVLLIGKLLSLIRERFFKDYFETRERSTWSSRRRVGVEANIHLPATGEEAMKRLLACKGKDPYSILGLRADASDEDIKKYYRKQAVLVHPDKNQEPGAEEAFKILGHAFEMIGEPAKRKQYDSHTLETNEIEAMREFTEMFSKLQAKIREAMNIMPCDKCGGKHRRVPVERPFYSARFCQRCSTRHAAKEGDVWAETTMLGLYWNYFALMEGQVFDITEWMKCHTEYFDNVSANSHMVTFKITTDGSRRNRHRQAGETNLEDIINRMFSAAADGPSPSWTPPPGTENSWNQGGASAAAAAAAKKNRRKKKRH